MPQLVDYGYGAKSTSAKYRNSDIDFRDVFGGPPRRASVHDVRYSFTEGMDSVEGSGWRIGEASGRDPWTAAAELPVFGEVESVNRRRYVREDFFDDIFKGGESPSSTPRNMFSSSPGSRVLSPARPLLARDDGSGSPSLPPQFSLPDKLSKGMELPTFGSTALSSSTSLDPPKISIFGFSTRAKEDSTAANHPSYRPSPLSQQYSLGSQESVESSEKWNDSEEHQFHFSIYKWANQGVPIPVVMPLNRTNSKNPKERQTLKDVDAAAAAHDDGGDETSEIKVNRDLKEEGRQEKTELKPLQSFLHEETGKTDSSTSGKSKEQQRTRKVSKSKDEVSFKKQDAESHKPAGLESTPKRRGKSKVKDFIRIFNQESPSKPRTPNKLPSPGSGQEEEEATANVEAATQQEKIRKSGVDDEKIKISKNLEVQADGSKPRTTNNPPNKSSARKEPATQQDKRRRNAVDDEKRNISKIVEVPKNEPDASNKIGSTSRWSQKGDSKATTTTSSNSNSSSSPAQKNTTSSSRNENVPERASAEEAEDFSQANFTIKELSGEEQNQGDATGESDEIQAADAKIHQWALGKEGNIRSLLTTLQFILWPESGWKPIALMNIIEGPGVKRAYQKAMLCLHPDKLQQKGASFHQKYVAEKVFDILQEAWDHFNTLGGS